MNQSKLKTYAPKARRDFIAAVTARAAKHGITKKKIEPVYVQGDVALIGAQPFPKKVTAQRSRLEERIKVIGFDQVMEAAAYTWFNRLAAIRYMEIHGYFDHGYRVLSHPDGKQTPEIVEHADHLDLPGLNKDRVIDLKLDGTKDEELYRMLLIAQCNALHTAMPFLFERIDDETELLLPDNLLHSDSLIQQMVRQVEEADWREIEIIGWLYQFYISEKKDEVIGSVVESENIPAATQLFTPNWIVKYMVHNSLGAKWLSTYPHSAIRTVMKYYIESADQDSDVKVKLAEITPSELNPEELTLLDPACGSGHILVEAYDLFREIYLERGYTLREIPKLILEKNLYGLDIDDRAAQMASFALLMKAREDDRRIFEKSPKLNVIAFRSGEHASYFDGLTNSIATSDDLGCLRAECASLLESLRGAEIAGTLQQISSEAGLIASRLLSKLRSLSAESTSNLLTAQEEKVLLAATEQVATRINILSGTYDCVVANPPYMASRFYSSGLKSYIEANYKDAKPDLYAAFMKIAVDKLKNGGLAALITIPNWMFLSTFEPIRNFILNASHLTSLVHNGRGVFGSDFGSCAFVLRKGPIKSFRSKYLRLFTRQGSVASNEELKERFFSASVYTNTAANFEVIPGAPVAYWLDNATINVFRRAVPLNSVAEPKQGVATADNGRFLRIWTEIDQRKLITDARSASDVIHAKAKWVPYNKGGEYRKWYGNREFVVNWENDGQEIKAFCDAKGRQRSAIRNPSYFFREGGTWSFVSSSFFGIRWTPAGAIFDVGGSSIFPPPNKMGLVISLLSSKLATHFLAAINPTLNFQVGNIGSIPYLQDELELLSDEINENFCHAVEIGKADWDSHELSWEFDKSPLLTEPVKADTLGASLEAWSQLCRTRINRLHQIEESNNRLLIEAYGLDQSLTPDIPESEIVLTRAERAEEVRRLVSYAVGCAVGRYSLVRPGLIFANSGNEGFNPSGYGEFVADEDGIIPVSDTDWFEDDISNRIVVFLKVAWSASTLNENLFEVANSLGARSGESPIEVVRRYMSRDFYKDHLRTYKRRPIYWLFSSGKEKAFEALVYLHRYNEGTLSRMRMEYVTPLQGRMAARIEQLDSDIKAASTTAAQAKLRKELEVLKRKQAELVKFDEELRHYADMRISLDLDDGVKVNYSKFGNLLAEVKAVTGGSDE
jgi:type II restriction/modification system DNA methylase subunit YeeA